MGKVHQILYNPSSFLDSFGSPFAKRHQCCQENPSHAGINVFAEKARFASEWTSLVRNKVFSEWTPSLQNQMLPQNEHFRGQERSVSRELNNSRQGIKHDKGYPQNEPFLGNKKYFTEKWMFSWEVEGFLRMNIPWPGKRFSDNEYFPSRYKGVLQNEHFVASKLPEINHFIF